MRTTIKILLTPLMLVVSLVLIGAGYIYFEILVRAYKLAWEGWEK
jgi:hypothetical protein